MSFKERTEIIFGPEKMAILEKSSVAVYGLGGVGAVAAVTLVRAGIGKIMVTDFDTVNESNLNRLIFGFNSTVGMNKTEVFIKTAQDINPSVKIEVSSAFMHGSDAAVNIHKADFHIDAIDSLNPKVNLIIALLESDQKFISSMGTGGKIHPEMLQIADIWKTDVCPLAKFIRKRLRNRDIKKGFQVVFSKENPVDPIDNDEEKDDLNSGRTRKTQGSAPFVPQAAGLILASYAVRCLMEKGEE
ncbi:MAG TPA: tRNA threonylcarbamoyladenosine dehydratase [bacterium]|nr:tRNA threonylcarbamoyladenosine dehydratase [bacterium]